MAITSAIPNYSKLEALVALCPPANVYKMALFTNAATLDKTSVTYSTANEVVGTGYTAGGIVLAGITQALDSDTAVMDFTTDPVWPTASITARGGVIYDSTNANKIRAILDFGSDITSTNAPFVVTFPLPLQQPALLD